MRNYDELIALLCPFFFSAVVLVFSSFVKNFAKAVISLNLPQSMSESVRDMAINLASHVYAQVAFFVTVVSSCVTCTAYTARSNRPILAVVGATILLSLLVIWFFKWQFLSYEDSKNQAGKGMRVAKWAMLLITCGITVYAWYSPVQTPAAARLFYGQNAQDVVSVDRSDVATALHHIDKTDNISTRFD